MINENLVIGFDGLSGVGKTSTAKYLCEENDNFVHIELGDLCRKLVPFWTEMRGKYSIEYITNYIKNLNIDYYINGKDINFKLDKPSPNINKSKTYMRNELYNMVQIEEIIKNIHSNLLKIIDELKNRYTVIICGRQLELIYPEMDYHFYFKANENDRISRLMMREEIAEEDAKLRKKEEIINHFSCDVITVNTSRLKMEEIASLIENVLKFRNIKTEKIKIQFVGAPSTGKTTMGKYCAEEFNDIYVKERIREYMGENNLKAIDLLSLEDNKWYEIISSQLEREKELINKANKFIFSDSVALLYSIDHENILNIPGINELIEEQLNSKNIVFVCDNDIPYIEDGIRPKNLGANIEEFQIKTIRYLADNNIPYFVLNGSVDERFRTVKQIILKMLN